MEEDKRKGSLTEEQYQKAFKWLEDKFPVENHECEICSEKNWLVLDDIVTPTIYSKKGVVMFGGKAIPQFMIMCINCGNTKYINAMVSGIINKGMEEENVS